MDKQFHPTLYWACDYLSMQGLKLIYITIRGHRKYVMNTNGEAEGNYKW